MATESEIILRVGTEEAVKSVADLKNNIKLLKDSLNEAEIGSEQYQKTLSELKVNQNALKDAMYATTQTGKSAEENMKSLSDAATGTAESYNGLVHRMAALKEELRATDVSTEQGKKRFSELAEQVNDVNNKLKAMDALQGNFQRNVGNYQSAFKGLGEKVDGFGKGLKAAKGSAEGMKGALDAASKTPALVLFGLLASAVSSLVANFKESEEGTKSMQAALVNVQPIINVFKNIVSKLSEILGNVIEKVTSFLGSSGILNKVIEGVMGVGNAILQFVVAPFKAVIAAIKVFQEEGIKGFRNASKAFKEEMKSGLSFKENYQAGQAVGDALTKGVKSKKGEAKSAGEEIGKEMAQGVVDGFTRADFDKALAIAQKKADEMRKRMAEWQENLDKMTEDEWESVNAEVADYLDEQIAQQIEMEKKSIASAEATAQARIALLNGLASNTASILGSIADLYEADDKNAEKNAEKIKALRIAEATINTISGAIGAYTQASATIPPPGGQVVGALAAASVTATGMAQIAKIRNQKIGSSSSGISSSIASSTASPSVTSAVSQTRTITSASEEERLNQMASSQRVYILQSDIEASGRSSKARVAEASF